MKNFSESLKKFPKMASAKVAKVKKQTVPKKPTEPDVEPEDGKKLSDYEILTTIGKNFFCFIKN